MLHKWNRFLSFLLAIALVTTTFGSDFATAKAYAVEGIETDLSSEGDGMADLSIAEEVTESNEEPAQEVTDVTEPTEPTEEVVEEPTTTDETQEEITEEETTEEEEASEEEITDETEVKEPEEEETVVKEKLVKVTYKAGKGGRVSTSSEEVDINKEDAAFEGSTATAWNDKYTFVDWTDEDGNQVSTEATFVPSDVTEDATFTANFLAAEDIETAMPKISADNVKAGDMIVSVSADAGLFPEGTEIVISAVDDDTALELAQEVKENATQAKAVDIKFVKDEQELQPADSKYVHVSLALDQTIEGDDFSVLHQHDGEVKEISADVDTHTEVVDGEETTVATAAEFKVNEFSIFIISNDVDDGNGQRAVATYKFYSKAKGYSDNTEIFTKLVKKDDVISNPGIPNIEDNQVFDGWYIDGVIDDANKITFDSNEEYVVPEVEGGATVEIYPNIISTYYVTFFGLKGEVAHVEKIVVEGNEEPIIDSMEVFTVTPSSDKAFKGWTTTSDGTTVVADGGTTNYVDARLHKYLYPIIIDAYWVRFDGNGSGATFTGPQYLVKGEKLSKIQSSCTGDNAPSREGYIFKGWSLSQTGTTISGEWNTAIENLVKNGSTELYLYAVWEADPETIYTVVFWNQKITDSVDTAETDRKYDYWDSYVLNGETGTTLTESIINADLKQKTDNQISKLDGRVQKGFHYLRYEIVDTKDNQVTDITAKGNTIVNVYYDRDIITLTFYKYGKADESYSISNTDYSNTTYYGLVDGEYKELERITTHTDAYWTYQQGGQTITHTGDFYYYDYYDRGYRKINSYYDPEDYIYYGYTLYHRISNNNYAVLTYHEATTTTTGWKIKGTNTQYQGDRYIKNNSSQNTWNTAHELKGLYGQTLSDVKQDWPTEADWWSNGSTSGGTSGEQTTFLDAFLNTDTFYGTAVAGGSQTINHYKQNLDGTYTSPATNSTNSSANVNFNFSNKYNGFTISEYARTSATSIEEVPSYAWNTVTLPDSADLCDTDRWGNITKRYNLYIRYTRNSYKLTFVDVDPEDGTSDNDNPCAEYDVLYDAPVAEYADQQPTDHGHAGYTFDGWYEDKTGTVKFSFSTKMPAANKILYAKWVPVKFNVNVDLNGGQVVPGTQFADSTLNEDGTRSFNVELTEDVVKENLDNGTTKPGWELVGWYYRNEDGSAGGIFPFGKIRNDVEIIAKWRYNDAIKVIYDAGEHGTYDEMTVDGDTAKHKFTDGYSYSSESAVKVAAKPDTVEAGWVFIGWNVNGTLYYPNDTFDISDDMIDESTKTVTITAEYKQTGGNGGENEPTAVYFNFADGAWKSEFTAPSGYEKDGNQYKRAGILVNESFTALGEACEKAGYVQTSWNTKADGKGLSVALGETIAADNINRDNPWNPAANVLYAIYEPVNIHIVVKGSTVPDITYDGNSHTNDDYSIKSITVTDKNGNILNVAVDIDDDNITYSGDYATGTIVGDHSKTLDASKFALNSDVYTNVTFEVDKQNDKFGLKIVPATLTITTGSAEKEYDGTALTNNTASVSGFVGNDNATITATGSQTEIGSSSNTYEWNENVTDLLKNYTLSEQLGTLTVKTNKQTEITITAASDSKTYDGTALTNSTATASGLPTGFTVVASASGSQTDAGESANVVNDGYVIKNAAGQDKTANFTNVKTVNGTLTVNKAEYRVTTLGKAKPYDGTALTRKDGATIDGLVNGETATVVPNGTITEVGSTPNTYDISWGTAKASNYKLAENGETLGTLTVSKAQITLRAESASKPYDGTPLTANKIYVGGQEKLPEGYKIVGTCDGSITNAGTIANKITSWDIVDAAGNSKKNQFELVGETIDGTLTVNKVTVTITTGTASKVYDGTALKNSQADISGLVNNESSVVTVTATGEQTDVGSSQNTYSIDWGTANADNYNIEKKLGTLTVTKNPVAITLTAASGEKTYDGTALTNATVTATGLPEGITTNATASGSQTDAGNSANVVASGYKFYKGTEDVTANFTNVTVKNGTLTVNKAPATITTGSGSKQYDGTALTVATASISGLVNNESATVTATGSQTEVGSSSNTYDIAWNKGKADNYNITENLGTLTVTENSAEVKLTAASGEKTYDGTALTNAGVTPSGLPEGFTVEATASGSQTDAGESANVVNDGYVIRNAAREDKTASFTNVKKVNGKLTVSQAPVTIKTGSDSKAYDGTALTKDEASITGLKNGETATVTATGTITEVGSTSNTYSIDWGTTKSDNYKITEELGTLTITANANAVTLTAPSDSKTYDGTALTADGTGEKKVTATGLPEGFTVEATATGSQTNAGSSANVVDDGYVIKNAADEDKTANFTNITKADGTLTVEKATVTVTTGTASKAYDGTPLTKDEASITGLVNGEKAEVTATGTITEVGSTTNTYSITWVANKDNYTVEESLGTLTITENAGEVILTAATASKTYDGQPLTDSTVTATGLPEGFTYEATASGSQTNYGSSANKVNNGYKFFDANGKDKTSNFTNVTKADGTLTVNKKDVTITTGGGSKEYDGTPLTNAQAGITGLVNNETAIVTATGSQTEVGSSQNTYSIDWGTTDKDNYTVSESLGTLEVTENTTADVKLTAASGEKTYDGSALTDSTVTVTGLPEGFTYEATATGSQTDAGKSANVVDDGYKFFDANGKDKTANFKTVEKVDGTLKVNKAPVTITTGSGSKEYDGTPLKNSEAGITGLKNNETATVKATGSQTEVGSSDNTYSIDWGTTDKDNYTVSESLGTLEVTENTTADVKLTAASGEKTYDGSPLTDSSVTVTGLPTGFTYAATASGSQTDAGKSANVVDDGYKFFDANGKDKTANFTSVSKVDGTLKVNQAPVTITTGSDKKAYDGTALTNAEAGIEATGTPSKAVTDQIATVTVTATGSQTNIGTSTNSYDIDWANVNKDNYKVTEDLGTLEVYANNATVTLTAASASKTYDGSALTKNEVTYTGLPAGIKVRATASGSQTDVGSSANTVTFYEFYVEATKEKVPAGYFTDVQKVAGTLTVNPATVIITTGTDSKEYDGTALTKDEANISGLVNNETATVTATGSQTEVGSSDNTYSIEWGTTKAGNYEIDEELGTLTVTAHNATVTLTAPSDSKTYDGTALTADGTGEKKVTADGLPAGFTVEATASGSQTDAGVGANVVNDGYKFFDAAGKDKTANFTNVSKVDGTLTVDKAPVTITTGTDSKPYDGKALTNAKANIEGLVNNETATVTATGSQTEVGSSDNTYSIEWGTAKAANYDITEELGKLTVTKNDGTVTLIAASDSKTYDGSALTNNGVTASGLPTGFTVEATASGSQLNAGTSANVVNDGYKFFDAAGNDKTANFTKVEKTDGTLTVNPVTVKITTESDSKAYDGTALTNDGATIEAIGDVSDTVKTQIESVDIVATGSQTEVGSSSNPYEITSWGQATAGNYEIKDENVNLGTLEVTANNAKVTLTAGSDNKVYDGKDLTNNTVTPEGLPEGFTVEATTSGSQKNYGKSANVVNDGYVIKNAAGVDKTANFTNVTKVDGTLEVTKAPVTITTGSGKKEYDGTPLTKDEANIEGLVDGESVTLKATGTITEVGTDTNTYDIKWTKASESNYEVAEELGTLEITKNSKEIKLTAASDEKVYDGKELKKDEVTPEGLPEGFTVKATAKGSQINAGTSANVVNDGYVIKNAAGVDKTANFTNIVTVDGELKVTKAPLTIKTNSKSKKYDGTPLTAGAVIETSEKTNKIDDKHDDQPVTATLINGETVTITLANKLTKIDKIDNTYAIAWGKTIADNYDLAEEIGTLEVTDRGDDAFVVYASVQDVTRTYNGTEWKNFDYSLTSNKTLWDKALDFISNLMGFISYADMDETTETAITPVDGGATFTVTGVKVTTAETDAGTYAMAMDFSNVSVKDPEGNEVKDQFTFVEDEMGKLVIEPAPLTVTTGSASRTFNNQPLTNSEASLSGLVEGEEATVVATGSQTAVGSSRNTYQITWVTAKESNYKIIENLGTLTVNAVPSGGGDTPSDPTPIPDEPTPTAAAPAGVLGARREDALTDGAAVLGARRGRTEDEANTNARVFAIVMAVAAAITALIAGKKKEEEED